ncbi:MAG: phosphodiester glycosidase family protein [Christensenellales bacterium]|jgi:exopolysaccharide biosynthesis protein
MESSNGRNVKVRSGGYGTPHRGQPGGRGRSRRKKLPIVLVIAIDVLLAALLLGIFYIVQYEIKTEVKGEPLPGSSAMVQTQPSAPPAEPSAPAAAPVATPDVTAPAEETPAPSPSIDPNDWRAKLADKFTGGEVISTDTSYKSANVSIEIQTFTRDNVPYYIADIYVADLKYFRTAFAKEADVMGGADLTDKVAKMNGAILAINGDHCKSGTLVRNGLIYRKPKAGLDVLVMYNDGSMKTFSPDDFDVDGTLSSGVYQTWSFGPMLLQNGQAMTEFNSTVQRNNPRTAIGYYEPGHYCFVVIGGRLEGRSLGCTMQELSQLMEELGCAEAYNLDGGKSSEMVFMDEVLNHQEGRRKTPDIVYITDDAEEQP